MKSTAIVHGLCLLTWLTGCHCADSFSATTEATLVSGENEFEVVFGAGSGTALIYVQLDDCPGELVVTFDEEEYPVSPERCRTSSIWSADFENSVMPMRVRSSDTYDTVVRVLSPGTDDLDDCSELVVEAVRASD